MPWFCFCFPFSGPPPTPYPRPCSNSITYEERRHTSKQHTDTYMFKVNTYRFFFKRSHVLTGCSGFLCFQGILLYLDPSPELKELMEQRISIQPNSTRPGNLIIGGHRDSSPQTLRKNDMNKPEFDFLNHALKDEPGCLGA